MKNRKHKTLKKRSVALLVMMIPGLLYLIINNYLPMTGIVLAFKKYDYEKGIFKSPWTGLSNFTYLLKSGDARIMIRNTLLYNLAFIVLGTMLAVMVAIVLNEIKRERSKKIYQVLILIPYLMSTVIVSYVVFAMLSSDNGFINNTILGGDGINWYAVPKYWPFILVVVYLWKSFGYSSIVYYATVIGIDSTLYEAAAVDGAKRFQKIWHITLPGIRPTIIMMTLMAVGKIFYSDFGLFYQVPQDSGLLYDVTTTIDVFVYKALMQLNDVGRSAAAGFFQSICGFILIVLANYIVGKIDSDSQLF